MAKAKTPRTNSVKQNGGTAATPVTPIPAETILETREVRRTSPETRKNVVPINLDEEIRRRAYELWEQRGRESGGENEDWLLAEREILGRHHAQRQQRA